MKTYQLRTMGEHVLTVKKFADVVTVTRNDCTTKRIDLPPRRWAAFRQVVDDTSKSVEAVANGQQNVNFQQHIGGAYCASLTSAYRCVSLRKWFQPVDLKGEIHPTKKGVALRFNEWTNLCALFDTINSSYPDTRLC